MSGRVVAGVLLMLIGVLLLVAKLGIVPINGDALIATWWPLAIIIIGLILSDMKGSFLGWLLILYGVLAQAGKLGWFSVEFVRVLTVWWPIGLILLGAILFIRPKI
ncbi:MAG: hypothetical protein LBI31_04080 [Zoogloeaceae bacterium]|jgi:hypothetical protein|nr:hypothetical protein [Zoogloeaceae bacterium]